VLRVLVVGSDSLSGELSPTVLGRPDVDRMFVQDSAAALAAAAGAHATLVVADLPRTEAISLVRGLRSDPRTRPCAIVWLNRSGRADEEADLMRAGANAVIAPPIDPFLWDRRLEELLSVPPRRAARIPVRLRDWSQFVRGRDEAEAVVLNIGARGVLLEIARPLELGGKVGLSFELPGDPAEVAVVGQVVRVGPGGDELYHAGIEFLVYRADARERIAQFVEAEPPPERPGAAAADLPLRVRPFEEAREWEEELRASEIRKALILDSALDCIVTADHEGRIVEFNAAARRLFGYSRAEVLGREVADTIVPPALRDELRRRLREFLQTGDSEDLGRRREVTAMRADGILVPVEVFAVPAYVKGRVLLTAYIRDLSELRREQRLALTRQRATQALTASLSLAEAAPAVLDAVLAGLACEDARLWLLDDGDPVRLSLAGSSSAAAVPSLSAPDDSLARRAVASARPVWEGPPPGGQSAGLGVPVRVSGQTLAVLEVHCPRAREQDPGWVATLVDVGSQLGLFLKRQRAEAELQRFARYDGLTGLPNRTFFLDTLERTLSRARRRRSRLALLFIDLDGFKAVNDRLGHAAGDAVLQIMAERLRAGTRSSDLVARIGGDEFTVLLLSLARADDAALVARALIERLARACSVEDQEIALGASAGIAVYPEDGTDADTLLRNADLAMYRAKQEGRNTYRFFTAEMSERALERMLLLDGLRVALERDEFELVYLPIFRAGGGVTGLEALLRWRHPKLGLVAPAAFIAQAEESGLILPIGTRVLRMATRFVASLPAPDVRLVVNLSSRQFLQPNLLQVVHQALEQSGLPASRLELDLTEPTVMAENDETTERIRQLREMGVQLALDDFGTGYFSIGRLRELGVRRLKIDRSFVAGLPAHAEHVVQVQAILALAASLGIEVVAEGVETDAQRDFLLANGCLALQGYLLSQPLAVEDVPGFVVRR
jgi:diguanylate cyclase (GGDEF)-like protein/PAS domain S-box-containing protein